MSRGFRSCLFPLMRPIDFLAVPELLLPSAESDDPPLTFFTGMDRLALPKPFF